MNTIYDLRRWHDVAGRGNFQSPWGAQDDPRGALRGRPANAWLLGVLTSVGLLAAAGCVVAQQSSTPAPAPAPSAKPPAQSGTLDEIKQLIGDAPCTSDSQCATVAVGAKSCGGPDYYLPWSRAYTDAAKLDEVAKRYAEERKAENKRRGLNSTCLFIPDPGARCVRSQATVAQSSASAAAAGSGEAKPAPEGRCQLISAPNGANGSLR